VSNIKARFLGGAGEVGRLGMLLEQDEAHVLFDYGMSPDKPVPSYPQECPPVDLVCLTHAHLDHSGMLPWVASRYESTILTTRPSAEVSTILHNDSHKIATQEGFPAPYDKNDIKHTQKVFDYVKHAEWRSQAGMELHFHAAGHIPGATMYELRSDRRILFTGDLTTFNSRLVWGAHPVKCDILFMESTYAGREHPDRRETEKAFLDSISDTLKRGGTALVPSFAVGRSQELALVLKDAGHEVWLDGMSKDVSRIFLQNPEFIRNKRDLEKAFERIKFVTSQHARKQAVRGGNVILTTSGMLDGGPVLYYLNQVHNDPRTKIHLAGFQVEGSNGRRLLETGIIQDKGNNLKIECQVEKYDFSAHSGHAELVKFAKASGAKDVILFHGDQSEMLRPDLEKFTTVHTPEIGDVMEWKD
jgi:putative mRNA 3-end processing factor